MEQLTKNQAVATSQEAVQNQNEPQLRDENAHRSEERFSRNAETDLVCRLLLEKKKPGAHGSDGTSTGPGIPAGRRFTRAALRNRKPATSCVDGGEPVS